MPDPVCRKARLWRENGSERESERMGGKREWKNGRKEEKMGVGKRNRV